MGLWMFLGYAFQAVGLSYTTAQRSGFLLYLNVKFVPFLGRFLFGKEIGPATWASALAAFAGTALLAYGGGGGDGTAPSDVASAGGGGALNLNVGDLWSVAAALASAMFILRLESASGAVSNAATTSAAAREGNDGVRGAGWGEGEGEGGGGAALNAATLITVAALSLIWTILDSSVALYSSSTPYDAALAVRSALESIVHTATAHPVALVYLGGVTTALANYLQTVAQRDVSAERASVVYAMDPVYGAIFASLLLGESLVGWNQWAGAGIIAAAAATNAFLDPGATTTPEGEDGVRGEGGNDDGKGK